MNWFVKIILGILPGFVKAVVDKLLENNDKK